MPYHQTEGIIKATWKKLSKSSSYSQICFRRVKQLEFSSNGLDDDDNEYIIIAIDSTA